jgi:DNA repair exonuclease SbcCD nuclease subunit
MAITFLHTADWQLGKPFARVSDMEKRTLIRQERINVIDRIGKLANERGASFIVVAGDLFDTPTVSKATVSQGCSAIGKIKMPVIVIPGNHDHGGPGSLWEQSFFQRERESLAPNLQVLFDQVPLEMDEAVIFSCPLLRRHEANDPTAWLREFEEEGLTQFGDKPRIILAHGSTQDFGGSGGDDEEGGGGVPNLINLDRLPQDCFDYIALGDWHGTREVSERAWYSGTPEPDRFPKGVSNVPGNVLVVTAERGGTPLVESVATAALGWHHLDFEFASDDDISTLRERFDQLVENRVGRDLLRLDLRGSLGIEATTRLEVLLESWESRLLRMKLSNETVIAPNAEEIEALTQRAGDPLISSVAGQLLAKSRAQDAGEAAIAHIALRELHALVSDMS